MVIEAISKHFYVIISTVNGTDVTTSAAAPTSTGAASNSTAGGVSPIDIAASQSDTLTPANTPTTNDTLGLDIEANDVGYIATVQIGTPPRDFKVLMDSGSADFWVGAEQCEEVQESTQGAQKRSPRHGNAGQAAGGQGAAGQQAASCVRSLSSIVTIQMLMASVSG